ncbi:MAG TPA: hypothetical protein VEW03_08385 [Longimicrobiaceae bacterium]|nr:hypothetical protein [Longimicrobiaceae bacterium]
MKFALIGALMITLPATAALVYGLVTGHQYLVYAALASFLLNTLPFLAAGLLMRKQHDNPDLGH